MGKQMYFMPRDNLEEDVPKKPKYGGAEECPGCLQPVYPMDRVRGVAESSQFLSEFVFAKKKFYWIYLVQVSSLLFFN